MSSAVHSRTLRPFGLILGALGLSYAFLYGSVIAAAISIAVLMSAILAPMALRLPYLLIFAVSQRIGRAVSLIILILVYYTVFFTARVLLFLARKDILGLKQDKRRASYWSDAAASSNFERMF